MIRVENVNKANIYYVELPSKKELAHVLDLSDKLFFSQEIIDGIYHAVLIEQPFMPTRFKVIYANSSFHNIGKENILRETGYSRATASVFVKNDKIIVSAVSGNDYHEKEGCLRKKLGIVSGQYELCPGCHPDVHSEAKAIKDAESKGKLEELNGSTNFLFNHWWVCEDCSRKMEKIGVKTVVLPKNWVKEFLEINE